ncbi:hypothetical protein JZ751_024037 [Albula glossodonta]|uniref:Neural precursor cell expressed, developmentally down-regulated 9 n=1 Tax=Albula glossodonta TaxID=121402 RepID=A0A8T2NG16_9TELE|nr:hypothetical protein JZ751_024037 [Albula glossodonta]
MRVGQSYTYDTVPRQPHEVYDVPPVRSQGVYDIPPTKQAPVFPGKLGNPRIQGLYDIPPMAQSLYDVPPTTQSVYDIPSTTQGVYSVPPCRNNPALQEGNYDFPQPLKGKPGGIYDIPPTTQARPSAQSNYDFPPSSEPALHQVAANIHSSVYNVAPVQPSTGPQADIYDIPRGGGDYDVPPQEPRLLGDVMDGVNRLSFSSTGSARSSMSTSSSASSTPMTEPRTNGPDLDSAVQRLSQLQQGVEAAVSTLLTLAASPQWRTTQFMEHQQDKVQGALDRVQVSVADLLTFGRVAAASALTLSDRSLQSKLRRQLQRLEDSQQILLQTGHTLEASGKPQGRCNDLDRFIMVSRSVPDDVKQLASTVSSSAELLFRRATVTEPFPQGGAHLTNTGPAPDKEIFNGALERDQTTPFLVPSSLQQEKNKLNNSERCVKSWMEDYDYVHLQGKEEFERQQKELLDKENIIKQTKIQLEQEQLNQFKQLEQEVIKPVDNDITQWISQQQSIGPSSSSDSSSPQGGESQLCTWDQQLLCFYSEQCESHFVTLLNAVDAFFSCISAGQPPRIFVAHSKFVILSAHKLVFIGDTLSRQASAPHLTGCVMNYSNTLCDLLKMVVGATKTAALHYPNTAALQEMVDRVTDLSHQAQQFKAQLLQLASF